MKIVFRFALGIMMLAASSRLSAQETAFTYQGQLDSAGGVANGSYDFTFTLFPANRGGSPASSTLTNLATGVNNGLFISTVDFGPGVFNGTSYWLELGVRTNGTGPFTILAPRAAVTPTPNAIFATTANAATSVSGNVSASQLSGAVGNNQLAHDAITITPGSGLSGGGAVALGGSVNLSNSGVISVAGNGDITASTAAGAVTIGDTATSTNTASTIVKRDASGNFNAGTISLAGTLNLANLQNNTGIGSGAISNNTSGSANTALGFKALYANTTGSNNIAVGSLAASAITTGSSNIDIGNPGVAGDANVIRVGTGQSQTFLVGSLSVNGTTIVDSSGNWVGNSNGLVGPQGPPGATGPAGANGTTILSGAGTPASALGTNGDFYINTSVEAIYGPKTGSGWGGSVSLIGAPGAAGTAGTNGINGTNGMNGTGILYGNGIPAVALGTNGDFYINTNGESIYGPKTIAGWGSCVSLVGPQGVAGSTGLTGPQGPAGPVNIKAGSATGSVSAAGLADLVVTFTTPYANTNYAIVLTPREYIYNSQPITVNATYTSKSTNGFTMNLSAGLAVSSPPAITCDWMAMPFTNP